MFSLSAEVVAGPAMVPSEAPRAPATSKLAVPILVVDNDPTALMALAALLRGWGYEVSEATGEAGAMAAMQRSPSALWLFDYNLDDGDTGTALQMRLGARFGARPTLILSADDSLATRRDVLEQGLTLLHKPVRPLALKSILDRLLASRGVAAVRSLD